MKYYLQLMTKKRGFRGSSLERSMEIESESIPTIGEHVFVMDEVFKYTAIVYESWRNIHGRHKDQRNLFTIFEQDMPLIRAKIERKEKK